MYKTLLELGCKPALKGFKYLQSAINYVMENPDTYMGDVYYTVAKEHKSTYSRVERAMRHCIEVASSVGSMSKWHEVFAYTIDADTGKVTNKEFVFALADRLKMSTSDVKWWVAKVTDDCCMSTYDLRVQGGTYTEAFMNALAELDKEHMTSARNKGIVGLTPLEI
jgi:hypothetical protein